MRIAFVVNDVDTEAPTAATTLIAYAAARAGHEVHLIGVGDLNYYSDGRIGALSRPAPQVGRKTQEGFLRSLQGREADRRQLTSDDLDVLFLRYNPFEETGNRPWEYDAGIAFGQMAVLHGLIVLSHPHSLSFAISKMYLEHFPEAVRPQTVITRSYDEVVRFHQAHEGKIVVKPLRGYGGKDVYLVDRKAANLKQIVESISRTSYIIAQEYLPAAREGDIRLFLFNGRPLVRDGHYAAIRRVNPTGDFRSNLTAGGKPERVEITPRILEIAELVRPRLLADGIFDVGLDIVGDKLVEINAISSGGLNAASKLEGVDFGEEVVRLIERKVEHRRRYGTLLRNRALAVLD